MPARQALLTSRVEPGHGWQRAGSRPPIPLWYDLVLLLSCACTGLLLGYLSLLEIQSAVEERLGHATGWIVAASSLLLSGFGIYLGRFLRWNSWEVVTDPAGLFLDISDRLLHPTAYPRAYAVTFIFGSGLLLGYAALRALMSARAPAEAARPAGVRGATSSPRST